MNANVETSRTNPFCSLGRWYWRDIEQHAHGPYCSQTDALRDLLRHCDMRSRWERVKELIGELIHA